MDPIEFKVHQRILPLQFLPQYGSRDFILSSCNQETIQFLDQWPWEGGPRFVALQGPKGGGKTHLLKMISFRTEALYVEANLIGDRSPYDIIRTLSQTQMLVLDDADHLHPQWLFHCYNLMEERKKMWVLSTTTPLQNWGGHLADWISRLRTFYALEIKWSDDETIKQILRKLFRDRGLQIEDDVLAYLICRIDRSYESLIQWCDYFSLLSAQTKRSITIPFIAQFFQK